MTIEFRKESAAGTGFRRHEHHVCVNRYFCCSVVPVWYLEAVILPKGFEEFMRKAVFFNRKPCGTAI
jgi:hypothetical protein